MQVMDGTAVPELNDGMGKLSMPEKHVSLLDLYVRGDT
jgi:hypothetical protein